MADSHVEDRTQRFREVPAKLEAAVTELASLAEAGKLQGVLGLGDIVNGNREDPARNPSDLEAVAAILDQLPSSLAVRAHILGNHCLDLPREAVLARLGFPLAGGGDGSRAAFYAIPIAPGWRLVALDTTEMSGHTQAGEGAVEEAAAYVAAHPLSEADPQMSPWNGGPGAAQTAWLAAQLADAAAKGERVVVAGHHQAGPGAAVRRSHAAWNWREVAAVVTGGRLQAGKETEGGGPAPSPAVLYLAGHDHLGGYAHAGGVHWVTVEAMVEAPRGGNAYAVLEFYGDRVEVKGRGSVTSRVLKL